jgi:hypothetical protein
VVQRSNAPDANHLAGASQRTCQVGPWGEGGRWWADVGLQIQGHFVPDPALGIALAAGHIPGSGDTFYWWADLIELV